MTDGAPWAIRAPPAGSGRTTNLIPLDHCQGVPPVTHPDEPLEFSGRAEDLVCGVSDVLHDEAAVAPDPESSGEVELSGPFPLAAHRAHQPPLRVDDHHLRRPGCPAHTGCRRRRSPPVRSPGRTPIPAHSRPPRDRPPRNRRSAADPAPPPGPPLPATTATNTGKSCSLHSSSSVGIVYPPPGARLRPLTSPAGTRELSGTLKDTSTLHPSFTNPSPLGPIPPPAFARPSPSRTLSANKSKQGALRCLPQRTSLSSGTSSR